MSDETAARTALLAKFHTAQRAVANVGKDGTNSEHHYTYTRAEDVIKAASEAIGGAGLVAWTEGLEGPGSPWSVALAEGSTRNNNRAVEVQVRGHLVIADPDTGAELRFPFIGTGRDTPGDKAIYKAASGALKYAWGHALQIAFGDDPEDDSAPGSKESAQTAAKQNGHAPEHTFGPPTADAAKAQRAVLYLLTTGNVGESDEAAADRIMEQVAADAGGYFPAIAGRALIRVAANLKAKVEQTGEAGPEREADVGGRVDDRTKESPAVDVSPDVARAQAPLASETDDRGDPVPDQRDLPADLGVGADA